MTLKKTLSILLAVVMLISVFGVGFAGAANITDYSAQYYALAEALKNSYVRELTNYTIENTTLNNETEGFNLEANAFAYEHKVTAKDNTSGDILKAANRFYYIAESLMSYTYGTGLYEPSMLVTYIAQKIEPYFNMGNVYEDFYGNEYYPTEEEIAKYNEVTDLLLASGLEVNERTLTQENIYFIKKDSFDFYNIETILQYFVGNVLKINEGNWYHRFVFVVQTSVDTCIAEAGNISNTADTFFAIRTGVYEYDYVRAYNESGTKSYFVFAEPKLKTVVDNYGYDYNITEPADDLTKPLAGSITTGGQAEAFAINVENDETTIPYLRGAYSAFSSYISKSLNEETFNTWDSWTVLTETVPNNEALEALRQTAITYIKDLTTTYSNEAMVSMFGDRIGNMVTMAYKLMPVDTMPTRTVRGSATYEATTQKLDEIVRDFDNLVSPQDEQDASIATRVGTIVKQFFNTTNEMFVGTSVYGMDFTDLNDLVEKLVNGLVFRDSIINTLVELIYPMIVTLLEEDVIGAVKEKVSFLSGTVESLLNDLIDKNELAIYPNALAERLRQSKYNGKYETTAAILERAGKDWTLVNFEALPWGVDAAATEEKAEVFLDSICAALSGFTLLLVTVLTGDSEYVNDDRIDSNNWHSSDQFDEWYDKCLLGGQTIGVFMRSQGLYTKLLIPLMRVLGLSEQSSYSGNCYGYLTSQEYHRLVDIDGDNCLKLVLEPIIYFVTDILGARPFETLWKLLPNLVNFFSRQSNVSIDDDWCDGGASNGNHDNFTSAQTHNIWDILSHVHIHITALGIKVYSTPLTSILTDFAPMLSSINSLLRNALSLTYKNKDVVVQANTCAYSNDMGDIVLPNSAEYAMDPEAYPNAHTLVYTNVQESSFSLTQDSEHEFEYKNLSYEEIPYMLPEIQEDKLIACGTVNSAWNTIDVDHPGLVLLYVLRYVCSALGYKYDVNAEGLPTLIECFGIDMEQELFQGLSFGDIIYNVMLRPDDAICALLELFYTNETGDYATNRAYTYTVKPINYYSTTLMNPGINPTLSYGVQVKYSTFWTREYATAVVANAGEFAEDLIALLGVQGFDDGIGGYLKNMLNESVFNNKLLNTIFNLVYQLLGGLNDKLGFNLETVLDAALELQYTPSKIATAIYAMVGDCQAYREVAAVTTWSEMFTAGTEINPETGEEEAIVQDVEFDWGIDTAENKADAFLKAASAILSPAAFVFRYLLLDYDLDLLGLIKLPSYAGYQYSFIALLEALSCPNIMTYDAYYAACNEPDIGDANVFYCLLSPLVGLLEQVYADPINTILNLIPNLMFFISIGGLNDLLNNLVHFAYVLLDIVKPLLNGYGLLNGLMSNIEIKGISINLSIPLDIDFNGLISDLVGGLVGDSLTIGGVRLSLPYIDFHTLCSGTLKSFSSKEERTTVHLDSAGGGDLVTALMRLVFSVVFMDENKQAIIEMLESKIDSGELDPYDKETLFIVLDSMFDLVEQYEVPDLLLFVVYQLVSRLTPLASSVLPRFTAANLTIPLLIASAVEPEAFKANLELLLTDPDWNDNPEPGSGGSGTIGEAPDIKAISGLFERLKAFFAKIQAFFQKMFNFSF